MNPTQSGVAVFQCSSTPARSCPIRMLSSFVRAEFCKRSEMPVLNADGVRFCTRCAKVTNGIAGSIHGNLHRGERWVITILVVTGAAVFVPRKQIHRVSFLFPRFHNVLIWPDLFFDKPK